MKRGTWVGNVGIEFTFLGKVSWQKQQDFSAALKRVKLRTYKAVHIDGGAIEIPSPILKNMEAVKAYWSVLHSIATELGLKTYSERECSGGGHIHFSLPKEEPLLTANKIVRDISNRPYVNWFFNDDCDKDNANCVWYSDESYGAADLLRENILDYYALGCCLLGKDGAVRVVNPYSSPKPHLEFRFFRAPQDWAEQRAHVEFIQHYVKWIMDQPLKGAKRLVNRNRFKDWPRSRCIGEFRDLIKQIGLDWKDYSRFVKNFDSRLKRGKEMMV